MYDAASLWKKIVFEKLDASILEEDDDIQMNHPDQPPVVPLVYPNIPPVDDNDLDEDPGSPMDESEGEMFGDIRIRSRRSPTSRGWAAG